MTPSAGRREMRPLSESSERSGAAIVVPTVAAMSWAITSETSHRRRGSGARPARSTTIAITGSRCTGLNGSRKNRISSATSAITANRTTSDSRQRRSEASR
jgi:hypothetical protein